MDRWEELFADLESQVAAADVAEHDLEVADRTRAELAGLQLVDRLRRQVGRVLVVRVRGQEQVRLRVVSAGPDWLLGRDDAGLEVVVPLSAVTGVRGVSGAATTASAEGRVAAALDLRFVLRQLVRDRGAVAVGLVDGTVHRALLLRVGRDHVDLRLVSDGDEEPGGAHWVVPLDALALLRRAVPRAEASPGAC